MAPRALDSLLQNTEYPYALVYVDGRSPPHINNYIREKAEEFGFQVVRSENYLLPNEARNMALRLARTKYVAFVDNDVEVAPCWLRALIDCAEETGADLVTPVICLGNPERPESVKVHHAGGRMTIEERDGKRYFKDKHLHDNEFLPDIEKDLERSRCDSVEFHCVLARREIFEEFGPLDEALKATSEHLDLSLSVRKRGGTVYFEPGAVVTYNVGIPLTFHEWPYFFLRWSDSWTLASEKHFHQKWEFEFNDFMIRHWSREHRCLGVHRLNRLLLRCIGWRLTQPVMNAIFRIFSSMGARHETTVSNA